MKAIQCVEWGTPDKLVLAELPLPEPGPRQVRIRIAAAGVNFPDALIVQKKYQIQPKLPFVPGTEVAGTIDEVGEEVKHLKAGDRVIAFVGVGAFAEFVCAPAVLAILVNTRGLTELIVLTVGLQLGVLDGDLYSLMVVMALVTTAMAGVLLPFVYPAERVRADAAPREGSAVADRRPDATDMFRSRPLSR